jgi:hypothetical protein
MVFALAGDSTITSDRPATAAATPGAMRCDPVSANAEMRRSAFGFAARVVFALTADALGAEGLARDTLAAGGLARDTLAAGGLAAAGRAAFGFAAPVAALRLVVVVFFVAISCILLGRRKALSFLPARFGSFYQRTPVTLWL